MAKSAIILAVFLFAGSAVVNAAPADDSNINVKDFLITYFKHTLGLQACDPPCINGGTCNDQDTCDCLDHFEGIACEIDPCKLTNSDPWSCYNGGNCVANPALPNGAECECPTTCPNCFTGDHCEQKNWCKIDAIDCSNRGICTNDDTESGYTCYCQPGYTGEQCEIEDICYPNPCQHGGICVDVKGELECECKDGYYGDFCEIPDPCRITPCFNGGTCSPVEDENGDLIAECECTPHYEGVRCENEIACDPVCVNGGLCGRDKDDNKICFCPPGYFGTRCEKSVCTPSPCYNGGTCNIIDGQANCTCPEGYSGDFCQINPCAGVDCGHGNCVIDPNSGETDCICHDGWKDGDGECDEKDNDPTDAPTTNKIPTTAGPTSAQPTTNEAPTTKQDPTTAGPTVPPTTAAPTTVKPTTGAPTTVKPTSGAPTTVNPTTAGTTKA